MVKCFFTFTRKHVVDCGHIYFSEVLNILRQFREMSISNMIGN